MSEASIQEAVTRAIKAQRDLLKALADFRVRVGEDSTRDPAVWVTLILDDDVLERIWDRRDELRNQVADIVQEAGEGEYWPYVSFQATSEQGQEHNPDSSELTQDTAP